MTAFKNSSLRDVTPGSRAYFRIFASFFGTYIIDNGNGNNFGPRKPYISRRQPAKGGTQTNNCFLQRLCRKEPIFQTNHIVKNKEKK